MTTQNSKVNLNSLGRKLYLDDIRFPSTTYPETPDCQWMLVRSYEEFVANITKHGLPQFMSFDHDLADEHYYKSADTTGFKEKTGFDCAKWLVEYCLAGNFQLPPFKVHSMNPVGKENIEGLLNPFARFMRGKNAV